VALPVGRLGPQSLATIQQTHAEVYAAHYGYADPIGAPLEATNWKLALTRASHKPAFAPPLRTNMDATRARKGARPAYIPEAGGFVECPVYDRYGLGVGAVVRGPAIVEERETTVVLLPRDRATVDVHGNLLIDFD
jgi:N-methylhydantoinase A